MSGRSRALYHHTCGAIEVAAGLEPMEALFGQAEHQAELVQMVEHAAARLNLRDFIGRDEAVRFERLWSIKAAAANREGSQVPPCSVAWSAHIGISSARFPSGARPPSP